MLMWHHDAGAGCSMKLTVQDIAAFIKKETGAGGMRLQKLVYYAQAWSLVWHRRPLFDERIEAWKKGPVSPDLFNEEKRAGSLTPRAISTLGDDDVSTIRGVLGAYGDKSAEWLSRLTHREEPWRLARGALPPEAPSTAVITRESMTTFYGRCQWGKAGSFDPAYLRGLEIIVEMPEDEVLLLADTTTLPAEDFLRWMETGDDEGAST